MKKVFLLLFILASLIYVIRFNYTGFGVYGDGLGYYAYDRSLVFDRDLNFQNEYRFWQNQHSKISGKPRLSFAVQINPSGKLPLNHWGIGSAVLWLPFYLLGHALAAVLNFFKINTALNGYSWPYELIIGEGNILLGVIALYLLYITGLRYASKKISAAGVLLLVFGSNLLFYLMYEPVTSHLPALFLFTVFIYIFIRLKNDSGQARMTGEKKELFRLLGLGVIGGLLIATRLESAVLIFPFFVYLIRQNGLRVWPLFAAFFLAFLPQLISWQILNGAWWKISYLNTTEAGGFSLFPGHVMEVLFSPRHGLFLWTPLFVLSLWGLKYFSNKGIERLLLTGFILQILVTSGWSQWWGGSSFGARFFLTCLPLFFLGLVSLIKQYKYKVMPLITTAVFYNILLFVLYIFKIIV
ncbi:MAG: hypothetical protein M1120_03340 [Patescibacteria group bacterium]|nr:hypothetical protein [Patescibacteria group bacterium]